jgi:hypothetical protein
MTHKYFNVVVVSIIILNSILLGMNDYTDKDNTKLINKIVKYSEPVFVTFFILEALIKIIAMGLIFERGSYL